MMRFALSEGSTRVVRAKSHRSTVRSGLFMLSVCNAISRTAHLLPLASIQATSSSLLSSSIKTGNRFLCHEELVAYILPRRAILDRKDREKKAKPEGDVDMVDVSSSD